MRAFWRVTLPLLVALGVLAWGAAAAVNEATQAWFMRDVALRARVVAVGAQDALTAHVRSGARRKLAALLEALARDERIMAAEMCTPSFVTIATTKSFPERFSCAALRERATSRARSALVVNPYDLEQASAALATALAMPPDQQAERPS